MDNQIENLEEKPKKNYITFIIIIFLLLLVSAALLYFFVIKKGKNDNVNETNTNIIIPEREYRMTGNGIQDFDLVFMQLENNGKNKVYSPLSIKYALEMLSEGSKGQTKAQIDAVIGDYVAKKYSNSANMSFANGLFIKKSFKNNINSDYITNLNEKYNADVIYDSFKNSDNVNKWVSDKTLNLINDYFKDEDLKGIDFYLLNALGIDMEWEYLIQCAPEGRCYNYSKTKDFYVNYHHEKYDKYISRLEKEYSRVILFDDKLDVKTLEIGAVFNKYDIVSDLGEENIRKTITEDYQLHLINHPEQRCNEDVSGYVDNFIKELDSNYKRVDISTDFYMYDDSSVKAFAKDLKEYDGITLQYVGIMPKTDKLDNYVKNINSEKLNSIISNLKNIESDGFKDGVITEISGFIPLFKYDYTLNLKDDLKRIGINDVFVSGKADLSNITKASDEYIEKAGHTATIDFSNEGIKAAAVTSFGGGGAATNCQYDYLYEVPVEKIDLTFDKPFLYIIRDKQSGEVWFAGTVYEPTKYTEPTNNYGY